MLQAVEIGNPLQKRGTQVFLKFFKIFIYNFPFFSVEGSGNFRPLNSFEFSEMQASKKPHIRNGISKGKIKMYCNVIDNLFFFL